jgi:uncharacterized membrane protein YkvA (DUF1232 family)
MEVNDMATKENRSLTQAKEGFFRDLYQNIRLIIKLMGDSRVNFLLKLLPVGALVYWAVPFDFLPVNPLDDALVIWMGCAMFLELCPDHVVEEHQAALRGDFKGKDQTGSVADVIDGDYKDVSD